MAASLLEGGLDVFCDQNRGDEEEKLPWEIWMEDKILESDHVLMVCTELYRKKIRQEVAEDEGLGVCWEAAVIFALLYQLKRNTTKFLPVLFSPADKCFIPLLLQGKQWFVIDTQSGYGRQHRARFPKRGAALQTLDQKTINPLFAPPGKTITSVPRTALALTLDKTLPAINPLLRLKLNTPPAPRQDIRGRDWYDECDAGHFLGRNDDADRILPLLLSHPVVRLVKDQNHAVRLATVDVLASFPGIEVLPLLRELALGPDHNVAAEAVHGLASLCSREELEEFLNRYEQDLGVRALVALDELIYMPEWLKSKDIEP